MKSVSAELSIAVEWAQRDRKLETVDCTTIVQRHNTIRIVRVF